jgi:hypothetical protein
MSMNLIRHHFHKLLGLFLLTAAAATALGIYYEIPLALPTRAVKATGNYACPMHPEVIAQRPDACSKCGMALVLLKADSCEHHTDAASNGGCSQHPGDATAAKAQDGCCAKKETATAAMILPAGHPAIAGYTVATNAPAE